MDRKICPGLCVLLVVLVPSCQAVSDEEKLKAAGSIGLSCSEDFSLRGFYNGSVTRTSSGSPCLKWSDFPDYVLQYPGRGLGHHRFCRNPDREPTPWCFIQQSSGAISWEYCDCLLGKARLVGGSSANSGLLEVYLNGDWGGVCNTHWTDRDASVVCRQLGLGDIGAAVKRSHFGPASVFHYERLGCRGNENSLLECQSRKFVKNDCSYGNAAGLVCAEPEGVGIPLRLAGGVDEFEGRVEVYHNGRWGAICDSQWDNADAQVVCRQLGLSRGVARTLSSSYFGPGPGLIWLDGIQCSGNELSLDKCPHSIWEHHTCQEAGVSCNIHAEGAVRLVGGSSYDEGRLEVYHEGRWGSVCDDGWTEVNSQVVCRQLGFSGTAAVSADGLYDEGRGLILLDEVQCLGSELSLMSCRHSGWGQHDCSHSEDVGVHCHRKDPIYLSPPAESWPVTDPQPVLDLQTVPEPQLVLGPQPFPEPEQVLYPRLRLAEGESRKEGRVEVFMDGRWGSICDDSWTDVNAAVVCRQLGFSGVAKARSMAYFGEGSGPIHMDNVQCSGSESSIHHCAFIGKDAHNCRHSEDAGVICDYSLEAAGDIAMATTTCGLRMNNQRRRRRIIGGDKSLRGEWPWLVSLWFRSQSKGSLPLCGASLISPCWLLTAAHCFKRFGRDPTRYVLRLGDYHTEEQDDFERSVTPERIIIHRKYHRQGWENDIALLRLKGTEGNCVSFNPHTGPVCLPHTGNRWQKRPATCIITGWGITDSEYLRTLLHASIPLLPARRCKNIYGSRFTRRMLCAGSLSEHHPVDSCQGDSGGPLVCQGEGGRWVLTGVISWGHGCGNPSFPGVYTRVSRFLPWIDKVINKPYKN